MMFSITLGIRTTYNTPKFTTTKFFLHLIKLLLSYYNTSAYYLLHPTSSQQLQVQARSSGKRSHKLLHADSSKFEM